MSKYTTQVRFICESYAGLNESEGYNSINTILENSWNKVFDFDFPLFDENYRKPLCFKILKHYYTREICAETVGRWKLFLEDKFNLMMDKYNNLYKALLEDFNPLYSVNYTRDYRKGNVGKQINDGTTTVHTQDNPNNTETTSRDVTGSTDGKTTSAFSDTPQGSLIGLETQRYMSNATVGDSVGNSRTQETGSVTNTGNNITDETGTANNTIDVNNTEDYLEHVYGKQGDRSITEIISEYRKEFVCIDDMIIEELADCFFAIY